MEAYLLTAFQIDHSKSCVFIMQSTVHLICFEVGHRILKTILGIGLLPICVLNHRRRKLTTHLLLNFYRLLVE